MNAWGGRSATGTGPMQVRTNSGGMELPCVGEGIGGLRLRSALPTGTAGTQGVGARVLNPLTMGVGPSRTVVTYTSPIGGGTTGIGTIDTWGTRTRVVAAGTIATITVRTCSVWPLCTIWPGSVWARTCRGGTERS